MGIQFRLGATDHKAVEDFLARRPDGVESISLDTKAARYQHAAADAAVALGANVYWEPAVERLTSPGHAHDKDPLWRGELLQADQLAASVDVRQRLVDEVIDAHPKQVTHVTPPHLYVVDARTALLNIDLAEQTRLSATQPVRAVLTIGNKAAHTLGGPLELAQRYADAGLTKLEIRMSPLGGEDESLKKIRDAFEFLDSFHTAGIHITLGQSGTIGQIAVALGHADAYSVGVGMLERVNHSSLINRQSKPPREREPDAPGGGPSAMVYLPGAALTVKKAIAERLLTNSDVRTSLGCRVGSCGSTVRGPVENPRGHYLHSRSKEMSDLLDRPAQWRATLEIERLRSAKQLRQRINRHYLDDVVSSMKTRTLDSLIDDIEEQRKAS